MLGFGAVFDRFRRHVRSFSVCFRFVFDRFRFVFDRRAIFWQYGVAHALAEQSGWRIHGLTNDAIDGQTGNDKYLLETPAGAQTIENEPKTNRKRSKNCAENDRK